MRLPQGLQRHRLAEEWRGADLALVALGVSLRLLHYFQDRSLWIDEARLALNVIGRSFGGLFVPLDHHQMAPPGFLLSVKAITGVLGTSEYALRLLPLVCGIAALPLFHRVAKRYVGPTAVTIGLALMAVSPHLVWYAAEFKQYSLDLLLTLLVLLVAARAADDGIGRRRAVLLAALGAIGLWFSYPLAFVLAGAGVALALWSARHGRWNEIGRLSGVAAMWLVGFLSHYLLVIRRADRAWLRDFWQEAFVPLPPTGLSDLYEWGRRFGLALQNPLGLELYYAGLAVLLIGIWSLGKRRWDLVLVLLLPGAFGLFAAALEQYPFVRRLLLFLVPGLALLVAEGLAELWSRSRGRLAKSLALGVVASLLWGPVHAMVTFSFTLEELRPVVAHLEDRYRPGDAVYVYYGAAPAFRYYASPELLNRDGVYFGVESRDDGRLYRADLGRLLGHRRAWIVFSHVHGQGAESEERFLLCHLDRLGVRRDEFRRPGASVFLYTMSALAEDDPESHVGCSGHRAGTFATGESP